MSAKRLRYAVLLMSVFVIVEAIVGYYAHSLALISDAGHNFADILALLLAWYGIWIAKRPANAQRTYGYHRTGILAALINAVSLVVIALVIAYEALVRLQQPHPAVNSNIMMLTASAALLLNLLMSKMLAADAKHNLNVRGAYLHMLGDALASCGVITAGLIIKFSGFNAADPVISLIISALILWSSWGLLTESTQILLESTPRHLDMQTIATVIKNMPGVLNVHDLHIWTVSSGIIACSCHLVVAEQSVRSGQQVLQTVANELQKTFHIDHSTIQIEVEGCDPNDMYCTLKVRDTAHSHHHHHH